MWFTRLASTAGIPAAVDRGVDGTRPAQQSKFHRNFLELSKAERVKFLTDVARPEYEGFPVSGPKYKSMRLDPNMSRSEHDAAATPPGFAFYKLVKEMTVEAFYSSKIGLIDVLEFKGLSMNPDFPGCTHPEHLA